MEVDPLDILPILFYLEHIDIPMNYDRARRKSKDRKHGCLYPAGKGQSTLLGIGMFGRKSLTKFATEHPWLYEALLDLSKKYCTFPVQNIMLNKNYITQKHYDRRNVGNSVIFSFGDYEGGELVVEGNIINTHLKTHEMNGSKQLHWNLPMTRGTKYSVIFFNHKSVV